MNIGDLFDGHATFWLVRKIDPDTKTGFLESSGGELQVVGFEEAEAAGFRRLVNVARDWPSAHLPQRRGRIVEVERASVRSAAKLVRFQDWAKLDDYQIGGQLFLNPALRLVYRDRLIATYSGGPRLPVEIPRDFAPQKAKEARQVVSPKPKGGPSTLFDHLLKDE